MIGVKAKDMEVHSLSDRKSKGEGCTVDCLCDAHFQFMHAMRLRTVVANMLQIMEKLLDRVPDPEPNRKSIYGPILVMDQGLQMMDHIKVIIKKNVVDLSGNNFALATSLCDNYFSPVPQG